MFLSSSSPRHDKSRNYHFPSIVFMFLLPQRNSFQYQKCLCGYAPLTNAATFLNMSCYSVPSHVPPSLSQGVIQSIIIRSLMLNSLVVINGGQIPGCLRHRGVQTYPAPHPVEAGPSCFSAWLATALNALGCIARAGTRPIPESFR